MDKENTSGLMGEATKDSGSIITCTGKECTVGETVECTRASILMIRSTGSESTLGQTDDSTTACGTTANSTEKENIYCHPECKGEVNGRMVTECAGLMQLHI